MLLGNLSIAEMEKRAGVTFPSGLVDFMVDRRQQEAAKIKHGKWHCFDAPFVLLCGDMETATTIHKYLSPLSEKFEKQLSISVEK